MKHVVVQREDIFGPWMSAILSGGWTPGRGSIIGLWDEVKGPVAACLYSDYNQASIMLHCASDGSRAWLNREFLWFVFYYPFIQLSIHKIISPVESDNLPCRRFIEHIGFTLEATLKDAAPSGDLLIYTMTSDRCRWLSLRASNGQTESTCTT